MVLGTPITGMPLSANHLAPFNVPSPPMAIRASTPASSRLDLMVSRPALTLSGCRRFEECGVMRGIRLFYNLRQGTHVIPVEMGGENLCSYYIVFIGQV